MRATSTKASKRPLWSAVVRVNMMISSINERAQLPRACAASATLAPIHPQPLGPTHRTHLRAPSPDESARVHRKGTSILERDCLAVKQKARESMGRLGTFHHLGKLHNLCQSGGIFRAS